MRESTETVKADGFTFKELILSLKDWTRYFWSKWYWIALFGLLGAIAGFWYARSKKPVYTATTSFVLETGNGVGSRLGSYAGIASTFGIDLGGAGGGLFEGENILELYRSRKMISSALLKEAIFDGKKQLLIDRYIDFSGLRKSLEKREDLKNVGFQPGGIYNTSKTQLIHDSIMSAVVSSIDKNLLKVYKKDKRLNIIYVDVVSEDQLFNKIFNETLVDMVNRFYIDTKTKKSAENVAILQEKADSVRSVMTGAIYTSTRVSDATPNQNPTRMTQKLAPIQNARANAEINQEILAVVLQNLELGKISLQKETPLLQVIDGPVLPLVKKQFGKPKGLVLGGITGGFLILCILFITRTIRRNLNQLPEPGATNN